MSFWVNTVSADHVRAGIAGGFTQADHGLAHNLQRMERGDYLVFYSSRTQHPGGKPVQAFTALGRVEDDAPYQVQLSPNFAPYRREVTYLPSQPALIHPLIAKLDFIQNKQHWGYPFRRGLFAIPEADFRRIASAMGASLP